jgi:hypothetical protein
VSTHAGIRAFTSQCESPQNTGTRTSKCPALLRSFVEGHTQRLLRQTRHPAPWLRSSMVTSTCNIPRTTNQPTKQSRTITIWTKRRRSSLRPRSCRWSPFAYPYAQALSCVHVANPLTTPSLFHSGRWCGPAHVLQACKLTIVSDPPPPRTSTGSSTQRIRRLLPQLPRHSSAAPTYRTRPLQKTRSECGVWVQFQHFVARCNRTHGPSSTMRAAPSASLLSATRTIALQS